MPKKNIEYTSVPVVEKTGKNEGSDTIPPPKGFGARHTQVLVLFISLTVAFTLRAHLSVTMVAMTGKNIMKPNCPENSSTVESNSTLTDCEISRWSVYRSYNWNKSTQEMILFSFFVGYTTMMLPMGVIAQKIGGKIPIMVALAVNAVMSILTPWMAVLGDWLAVCTCRLLQGMTQAAFYPSIHTMLGKWAPLSERSRLSTYVYTGSQFGTVVAFQLSGLLADSQLFGWPATFWFSGVASLVCFCMLAWFGSASPHEHPLLSLEEFAYIMADGSVDAVPKKRRVPWREILTSKPVWGVVAAHVGSAMGYLFVLTQIPLYMNKILGVDIKKNGLFSSLPYIFMYFTALLFGYLADLGINKKVMSVTNIRRVGNTIGMVVASVFLVAFCYVYNTFIAVILLILSLSMHSGVHVGFHVNTLDLAPNFAGTLMSLGNMIANLSSLLVPVMMSNIVGDYTSSHHRWQIMFIIMAAIQVVTNTIFVVFVSGTVQPWNFYGENKSDDFKETYDVNKKNFNKTPMKQ